LQPFQKHDLKGIVDVAHFKATIEPWILKNNLEICANKVKTMISGSIREMFNSNEIIMGVQEAMESFAFPVKIMMKLTKLH